ncbi:MAG: response regulator transcription factor [Rhizobiales bacterium]|nr:response regulator transcription factor [Hyphomicrobiales bacterium]
MRVLLIEDERRIVADVSKALFNAGFVVESCTDGENGWFRGAHENFDVVVLDLGLPKLDGISVLRRWRRGGRAMPVLLLTARDGWREKVQGIDAGADDHLSKPFHMEELVARVRALARRAKGHASAVLAAGPLEIDTRSKAVTVGGQSVAVSPLEYRLLSYLLHQGGRVVSQGEIREHIYSDDKDNDSNAIEVLVARLRRKLDMPVIKTVRGHGYVVEADASGSA